MAWARRQRKRQSQRVGGRLWGSGVEESFVRKDREQPSRRGRGRGRKGQQGLPPRDSGEQRQLYSEDSYIINLIRILKDATNYPFFRCGQILQNLENHGLMHWRICVLAFLPLFWPRELNLQLIILHVWRLASDSIRVKPCFSSSVVMQLLSPHLPVMMLGWLE